MTYQVLARKWRPTSFDQLIGQEPIKLALIHALERQRLHHAYLFCGTRGVGKTTLGRLLAKCLNCETGITAHPCGVCDACVAIDAGNYVDLIEVDGASRTRVEDMRDILDNVPYAPSQGRFKIYLIDEVHMLSMHSFNALLKTLEEPPAHVKFILATTDVEKLPVTVLSRCLKFVLRPIAVPLITQQLINILEQENIPFEKQALPLLARAAEGSMRDALSLLEQAIGIGAGLISVRDVELLIGLVSPDIIARILQALSTIDTAAMLAVMRDIYEMGADVGQVLQAVMSALHAVTILQQFEDKQAAVNYLLETELSQELLVHIANQTTPEDIQLFYQIALMGHKDLGICPDPRIGFEMTLLRMLAFTPMEIPEAVLKTSPVTAPIVPLTLTRPIIPISAAPQVSTSAQTHSLDWPKIVAALPLVGLTKVLAKFCELKSADNNKIELILDSAQRMCLSPEREKVLRDAVSQHLGAPIGLKITVGAVSNTPAAIETVERKARQDIAEKAVASDPAIQNLVNAFGASIESVQFVAEKDEKA